MHQLASPVTEWGAPGTYTRRWGPPLGTPSRTVVDACTSRYSTVIWTLVAIAIVVPLDWCLNILFHVLWPRWGLNFARSSSISCCWFLLGRPAAPSAPSGGSWSPHCGSLVEFYSLSEWIIFAKYSKYRHRGGTSALSWPGVRISAYTNQSRVSHSVRMREYSAEEYPKQSSLERSF